MRIERWKMSRKKEFQKVYLPGSPGSPAFVDDMATQEAFVEYMGGRGRADAIEAVWKRSWPMPGIGGGLGKLSKTEVFKMKALREGFTAEEVRAFLML